MASGFNDPLARRKIINEIKAAGLPWSKLVLGPNLNFPLRVVAPYHGIDMGLFPANQLDAHINAVWQKYQIDTVVGLTQERTYVGKVVGNDLIFNEHDPDGPADPPFKFAKPSTYHAYQNFLPFAAPPVPLTPPGDRAGAIGALIAGNLMRTTLLLNRNMNACNKAQFYTAAPVNVYAKVFHKYGLRKQAYSFGFDDTCDQSSFFLLFDPTVLTITLQGF
jgi:hypothetical protein